MRMHKGKPVRLRGFRAGRLLRAATLGVSYALSLVAVAQPGPMDAAEARSRCDDLVAHAALGGTTLTADYVAAGSQRPAGAATGDFLPGYCRITGRIDARVGVDGKPYAMGFQLSLPDHWNGRFLYLGGVREVLPRLDEARVAATGVPAHFLNACVDKV